MTANQGKTSPCGATDDVRAEYQRRAAEVAAAVERSAAMERDFLETKVLNQEANAACAESLHKRREFAAWLMSHHAELFVPSETPVAPDAGKIVRGAGGELYKLDKEGWPDPLTPTVRRLPSAARFALCQKKACQDAGRCTSADLEDCGVQIAGLDEPTAIQQATERAELAEAACKLLRAELSARSSARRTTEFENPSTEGDADAFVSVETYNSLLESHAALERELSARSATALTGLIAEMREKYSAGPHDSTAWALNELEARLKGEEWKHG